MSCERNSICSIFCCSTVQQYFTLIKEPNLDRRLENMAPSHYHHAPPKKSKSFSSDERVFPVAAFSLLRLCSIFKDAKRKLRMMLSEADLTILSSLPMTSPAGSSKLRSNELIWLLKVQLAEAHNLQDRNLVSFVT